MFGLPALGGTEGQSKLQLDPKVEKYIKDKTIRALRMTIEGELIRYHKKMEAGSSEKEDWEMMREDQKWFSYDDACYVVFKRKHGNVLINWLPDTIPVKKKFLYANSNMQIKNLASEAQWKEYRVTELDEVTWHAFAEFTRTLTAEERLAAMSPMEQEVERVKLLTTGKDHPKMLPGMAELRCQMSDGLRGVLTKPEVGDLCLVRPHETVEMLDGHSEKLSKIEDIVPKMSRSEPCYVVWYQSKARVYCILWSPDSPNLNKKMQMQLSVFARGFKAELRSFFSEDTDFVMGEFHDIEDFTQKGLDDLGGVAGKQDPKKPTAPRDQETTASGKKLPPGAFAMPGLVAPKFDK